MKLRYTLILTILLSSCGFRRIIDYRYLLVPVKKPYVPPYYVEDIYDGLFDNFNTVSQTYTDSMLDATYSNIRDQYKKELMEFGFLQNDIRRKEVMQWALYFSKRADTKIQMRLDRGAPYLPYIKKRMREEGLPESLCYLPIIESAFRTRALSRKRARGIWQFIASTARKYGLRVNWWMDERLDPYYSTEAAIKYFKDLYAMFGRWDLALAAYNAGEGRVLRAVNKADSSDFFALKRYLRRETREYVPKFLGLLLVLKNPEKFNTSIQFPYEQGAKFDIAYVPRQANVSLLAKWAGTTQKEFRRLNPSFIRWATPPGLKHFKVRIPKGRTSVFYAKMKATPKSKWNRSLAHRMRRGENLWYIARRYGVSVRSIMYANNIRNPRRIRPGKIIIIPYPGTVAYRKSKRKERAARKRARYKGKKTYIVNEGETLWSISRKFGVSVRALKKLNKKRTSRIKPGEELAIPSVKRTKKQHRIKKSGKFIVHRVKKGETLWDISRKFGISVSRIKHFNNKKSNILHAGEEIAIPKES